MRVVGKIEKLEILLQDRDTTFSNFSASRSFQLRFRTGRIPLYVFQDKEHFS